MSNNRHVSRRPRVQKNESCIGGGAHAAFEALGLSEVALAAVNDLGYEEPTPVQAQAIPAILAGSDVMAAAQTGTGKTAAFILPTLDRLGHASRGKGPLMLVVTPTRELAQQIFEVATTMCAHSHHRATSVVGGVSYEPQRQALERGCDLLVATPGRLIDLMQQGSADLSGVEVLVLDEADRMLDMGFLPDMRRIVAKVGENRQTLLFSATLSADVLNNVSSLVCDPVRVEIAPEGATAERVTHYVLGVSQEAKKRVLVDVLRREGADRVIAFVRGKHRADHLCRILRKKGISCAPIHGNRTQNQRMRALEQFRSGEVGVLVATDVLARGIDIPEVAYVLNVDVPHESKDYIHRIGRTGRAGEEGWALTFCSEDELEDLTAIEALMGTVIDDYPHAEGLDVGETPAVLDPERQVGGRGDARKPRRRSRSRGKGGAKVTQLSPQAPQADAETQKDEKGADARPQGRRGGRRRRRRPASVERTRQQAISAR